MLSAVVVAVAAWDRWLLTFTITAVVVLVGGVTLRKLAQRVPIPSQRTDRKDRRRGGIRRGAAGLLALGPLIGLVVAENFSTLTAVVAIGAFVLALYGLLIERSPHGDKLAVIGVVVAAVVAVAAGAELGPTGIGTLDTIGAFVFIVAVVKSVEGFGNVDGLVAETGAAASFALFAIAGFGIQHGLAGVFAGTASACVAFLAFNLRPAALFVGRGGRLAVGFVLAVGALAVEPVPGGGRALALPLILLALFWFDALVVVVDRLRRRHSLLEHRSDHLVHRLASLGWTPREAVAAIVFAQCVLGIVALFTARAVMPVWLGGVITFVVLLVFGIESARARLERDRPVGFKLGVKIVIGVVIVGAIVAVAPLALVANDTVDLMQQGRDAASRALTAARDGDTVTAKEEFNQAALSFGQARDKIESPSMAGGLAVPFLASNVHAARTLSEIGTDLANAGVSLTAAVDPEALKVVNGTLPLDEVRKITPKLERGSAALTRALAKLDTLRDDPYLLPQVTDAVDKVHGQLARAEAEASRVTAAAKLAPAIFGGDGPRKYLLVVQNNAESRATGGFIGDFAIMTAQNGKITVGDQIRSNYWNDVVRDDPGAKLSAPEDYLRRYSQFQPQTNIQNINMSPDFPSVAQALMSLAPNSGVGAVDGVMSVDPQGLAALLELSGPVTVPDWPTQIDSGNVVDVTLRDAYAAFPADSVERVDFLGDVAHAAVEQATSGSLGKPAQIAKVLGKAAHEGHFNLAFSRPEEQDLAVKLGVAQQMAPVHSDAIAVTTSNAGGNKIDYYMKRSLDYRVKLTPNNTRTRANASGTLSVVMDNTAPSEGLPSYVIGPSDGRFQPGEAKSFLSMYSPLGFTGISVDGTPTAPTPGRERGRNVYSLYVDQQSMTQKNVVATLDGTVKLHDGWYSLQVRHQPTLNADTVHVSVDVPEGWKIDRAPKMELPFDRRANVTVSLDKDTTLRVHLVKDVGTWDLWDRLVQGQ